MKDKMSFLGRMVLILAAACNIWVLFPNFTTPQMLTLGLIAFIGSAGELSEPD